MKDVLSVEFCQFPDTFFINSCELSDDLTVISEQPLFTRNCFEKFLLRKHVVLKKKYIEKGEESRVRAFMQILNGLSWS